MRTKNCCVFPTVWQKKATIFGTFLKHISHCAFSCYNGGRKHVYRVKLNIHFNVEIYVLCLKKGLVLSPYMNFCLCSQQQSRHFACLVLKFVLKKNYRKFILCVTKFLKKSADVKWLGYNFFKKIVIPRNQLLYSWKTNFKFWLRWLFKLHPHKKLCVLADKQTTSYNKQKSILLKVWL